MLFEPQLLDAVLYDLITSVSWYSLDSCEEPQMLLDGHQIENRVVLRTVSDQLSGFAKLSQYAVASDRDITTRWHDIPSQTLECCRFAGSIDTKQRKTLTVVNTKANAFDCEEWLSK